VQSGGATHLAHIGGIAFGAVKGMALRVQKSFCD
jgi:hypothetical protein